MFKARKSQTNPNICLFWGGKTTSPSQPSRDAALSLSCRKRLDPEEERSYVCIVCPNEQPNKKMIKYPTNDTEFISQIAKHTKSK